MLDQLNSYLPKLKFATEVEKDDRTNFLDTLTQGLQYRNNLAHKKNMVRKIPQLQFHSLNPIQKSVISGIADKALKLT